MNSIGIANSRTVLLDKITEACNLELSENTYLSIDDKIELKTVAPYKFMATMTDIEVDNWLSQLEDDDNSYIEARQYENRDFYFVVR